MEIIVIVKPTQINGIGPCSWFFWIGHESETVATIFETTRAVSAKTRLRSRGKIERCSEVCKVHRLGEVDTPASVVPLASIICAISWEEKSNRNIWEIHSTCGTLLTQEIIAREKYWLKPTQPNALTYLQRLPLSQCCLCSWWNGENRVYLW